MKIKKFCTGLSALSSSHLCGERFDEAVSELVSGLAPFGTKDTEHLFDAELSNISQSNAGRVLGDIGKPLRLLHDFVSQTAAPMPKRAFTKLQDLANDHPQMSIRDYLDSICQAFVPGSPVQEEHETLEGSYVRSLTDALHDEDRFPRVFGALIDDPRLSKDSIVEIASEFAFKMAKSTSKKTALERIWKMHDASQAYADKAKAMRGQSAA